MNEKTVAFIFARSGSKGVKNKNIQLINNIFTMWRGPLHDQSSEEYHSSYPKTQVSRIYFNNKSERTKVAKRYIVTDQDSEGYSLTEKCDKLTDWPTVELLWATKNWERWFQLSHVTFLYRYFFNLFVKKFFLICL